ncbi:MAG TPA: putative quinol monooxygenase [Solirubrobacteraceae bacterium]|nr:putative quinol monooxygenase [Solirubrobacteraceae bacterium]
MTVIAVARVHGVAAGRAQLIELLRRTAAEARAEPGCRSYEVAEAIDAADEFVVVHGWQDEAALEAHYRGSAHQAYRYGVFGLLARPSELAIHQVASTEYPVDPGPMDPRQAD